MRLKNRSGNNLKYFIGLPKQAILQKGITTGRSLPVEGDLSDMNDKHDTDRVPLYISAGMRVWRDFLEKKHPEIDFCTVLEYAEMTTGEIEDRGHWFNQRQADRFNEIIVKKTGNPDIAREAGRYAASAETMGPMKQYVLGLMNISSVYMLLAKLGANWNRGLSIHSRKLGPCRVEVINRVKKGVDYKEYQCRNSLGTYESIAMFFTRKFAKVEHPECVFRGSEYCRYIVSWEDVKSLRWKRASNFSLVLSIAVCTVFFFSYPGILREVAEICAFVFSATLLYTFYLETNELSRVATSQGDVAMDRMQEISLRYNHSVLIREIGEAISAISEVKPLVKIILEKIQERLQFDQGVVLLLDHKDGCLRYCDSFGVDREKKDSLKGVQLNPANPDDREIVTEVFRSGESFVINDRSELRRRFPDSTFKIIDDFDSSSFIFAPILWRKESYGVFMVSQARGQAVITSSDFSLFTGIVSQFAVSLANIRETQKKYRELVENANSIIMRTDSRGAITFFNEFAQKLFQFSESEILGKTIPGTIFSNTEANRLYFKELTESLERHPDKSRVSDNENIKKDGETLWITWSYKPVFDREGVFNEILCIGTDITELREAERNRRKLEEKLQQAEKLEAIGTLAGGVAHDLNNILSGLVGYPELLLMDLPEESPFRKTVEKIKTSGEKAAGIVQDLLIMARRSVPTMRQVNVNRMISSAMESEEFIKLQSAYPEISFEFTGGDDLSEINGSKTHLSKALLNLLENAVVGMPEGGRVEISTEIKNLTESTGEPLSAGSGEYAVISVRDCGPGISPEDMESIFEPFYTKKVMGRPGTGLGMSVVRGVVKDHRGFVTGRCKDGGGTEFTMHFPTHREKGEAVEIPGVDKTIAGSGKTVLVVDDVEDQRRIAADMLRKLGYSVSSALSGEEALEYLKTNSPDIVVLDMIMEPGMDGLDTMREILKRCPLQKVIIATGYSETDRLKEVLRLGATTYIKKPYLLEEIGSAVREASTGVPLP